MQAPTDQKHSSGEGWLSALVVNTHPLKGWPPQSDNLALTFLDNSNLCRIVSVLCGAIVQPDGIK